MSGFERFNLDTDFDLGRPSVIVLILANLVPLFGVIWFGWDAATILFLYWVETVIIGLLNLPKMFLAQGIDPNRSTPRNASLVGKLFLMAFFTFHYGFFCFGHWMFLGDIIGITLEPDLLKPGSFFFWAIVSIFGSHLISMIINFFGKGEYRRRSMGEQMFLPYTRIVVMHMVIIFGGAMMINMGNPLPGLVMLVLLKTLIDVGAHGIEHRMSRPSA